VWRDWVLVAVLPLIAVFEGLVRTDIPHPVASVVVTVVAIPMLLWRRSLPLTMLLIAFALNTGFRLVTGTELQLYSLLYVLLLAYAVFRWGTGRAIVVGLALMLGATTVSAFTEPFDLATVVGGYTVVLLTATLGLLFRLRARLRIRELERARSNEREGLARDLHDTVAHHVSAIAIQAQAGLADPTSATAALETIEREASRTLTEMRAMVRVLRSGEGADLTPAPGIADVKRLTDDVVIIGDVDAVPTAVSQAVYRIAQESITNARRHARNAGRIEVRVSIDRDGVTLRVHDDGTAATAAAPGFGITGMSERAALLGGTVVAGPAPAGGWTVTAEIPA
jgi:signal transduction histidine kinase